MTTRRKTVLHQNIDSASSESTDVSSIVYGTLNAAIDTYSTAALNTLPDVASVSDSTSYIGASTTNGMTNEMTNEMTNGMTDNTLAVTDSQDSNTHCRGLSSDIKNAYTVYKMYKHLRSCYVDYTKYWYAPTEKISASSRNTIADYINHVHTALLVFVIAGWTIPFLRGAYLALYPAVMLGWAINGGKCILTIAENRLRGTPETTGFIAGYIHKVTGLQLASSFLDALIATLYTLLWYLCFALY